MKRFISTLAAAMVAAGVMAAPKSVTPTKTGALTVASGQTWFSANGITYVPVGPKSYPEGDWYVLCAYDTVGTLNCKRLVPVWSMKGILVQSQLGADGTPITTYAQTEMYNGQDVSAMSPVEKVNLAKSVLDSQSLAIAVFEARLADAITQFDNGCAADVGCETSASAMRSGRAPSSSSAKASSSGAKADSEPEPRSAKPAGGKRMQTVEVPGQIPDPEYPPNMGDPVPDPVADPTAPSGDGGNDAGGLPDQPDGSGSWRKYKMPSETCVATPPLPGMPVVGGGCVVRVPAPHPVIPPDPETQPLPPPPTDWCRIFPGACAGADGLPPNVPNPMRDMCNSRFLVKAMRCYQKRLDDPAHVTDSETRVCVAGAQAQLAICAAGAPPALAAPKQ
jgi:hypothetical protein